MTEKSELKYHRLYETERLKIEKKIAELLVNQKPVSLYEPCAYIMESGGKRLRPLLVLFSAKAAGGEYKNAYNAAVAVELLHNFTLVHDDIMDHADKRRGRITIHKKYDLSTAILTGDNLVAVAYMNLLKDCKEDYKGVLSAFTRGIIEVCEGQSLDKDFELKAEVCLAEYLEMIEKKTAALLETCCAIGARLGGGSEKEIKALARFGRYLGIAFQIQDDLLDITAQEAEFGKIIGGDLVEGKKTFLFLKALTVAQGNDLKMLMTMIENKGIDRSQVELYRQLYVKLGVIDQTKAEIEKYTKLALKQLNSINGEEERNMFVWLASSLIKRNK